MTEFAGKGVNSGIAVGKASLFIHKNHKIVKHEISDTDKEIKRFERARAAVKERLNSIYDRTLLKLGKTDAEIFKIHIMMLDDEDFNFSISDIIAVKGYNAEYAVSKTGEKLAEQFLISDNEYIKQRADDVRDICTQLLSCLEESYDTEIGNYENTVVCADDLTPSEIVLLSKNSVLAFALAGGSLTSHTAILAKNMNIPTVIGLGEKFLSAAANSSSLIVDADVGMLISDPDKDILKSAEKRLYDSKKLENLLQKLKGQESITSDGRRLNIYANISGLGDVKAALENDAEGIGLFRSEFLYLESNSLPTEEQQFEIYRQVLSQMKDKEVIIRTLDIGADKQVDYFQLDKEHNPAMGLRAIRLCLTNPGIFKTQLRALYRASCFGKLGIMFPMITSTDEVKEILKICEDVKSELKHNGIEYSNNVKFGIMIETPAAALISNELAELVDFFSIGTNDLTQYTLACDRQNPKLDRFCNTHHKAVLRLIELTVKNAHAHNIHVGICGELGADTTLTESFIKMGVDEISVSPKYVLTLRQKIRSI